jgi:hypothetical protein
MDPINAVALKNLKIINEDLEVTTPSKANAGALITKLVPAISSRLGEIESRSLLSCTVCTYALAVNGNNPVSLRRRPLVLWHLRPVLGLVLASVHFG